MATIPELYQEILNLEEKEEEEEEYVGENQEKIGELFDRIAELMIEAKKKDVTDYLATFIEAVHCRDKDYFEEQYDSFYFFISEVLNIP